MANSVYVKTYVETCQEALKKHSGTMIGKGK